MFKRIALSLALVLVLAGCSTISGSGTVITETRPVSGIDTVELAFPGKLTVLIDQTGTESLAVEGEDNIVPRVATSVTNGRLLITSTSTDIFDPKVPLTLKLTVKELKGLVVTGFGTIKATNIQGEALKVEVKGQSTLEISGTVKTQDVQITGLSTYQAFGLASKSGTVSMDGANTVRLNVSDALTLKSVGGNNIEYAGNPALDQTIDEDTKLKQVEKP